MTRAEYQKYSKELTPEEQEKWFPILNELDRIEKNNERRHKEHRADMDVTIVERDPEEGECYRIADLLRLSRWEDWNDIIFSQSPDDLYHLVEEYPVSEALKELTSMQKKILLENVVHGRTTKELAKQFGCSERNITKHRQKALEAVRFMVTDSKELIKE